MYAIIRSGGKQYRVAAGDRLQVERDVLGSADQDKVTFNEVLMVGGDSTKVGNPTVQGATVAATVLGETRGTKIIVFKKKRRKNHTKRTHGHRQDVVEIRIDSINLYRGDPWLIKKDRALRATAATRSRKCWASSASPASS